MKGDYKIFYSWQSDLPNATNRGFIVKALEIALESIRNDNSLKIEPAIDRDTTGVPGIPDIAGTILNKIEKCQIFVCDVSFINSGLPTRLTPNPNVLVELGYALRSLGPERVLMVMNSAFGKPEMLPFDLRMKRVISYEMLAESAERSKARKKLASTLEEGIRIILDLEPASAIKRQRWAINGMALAKRGREALEEGDFDTVKEVFIHLVSLSDNVCYENYLRGGMVFPSATPFSLAMQLLKMVINTDFSAFLNILQKCRIHALIGDKPIASMSNYEQIPDSSISVMTGVLVGCCANMTPTKNYWAEKIIVEKLCCILLGLGFILVRRGLGLPPPTTEIWIALTGDRAVPDGQPKEYLPCIQLVHRMAYLPEPLFSHALENLKYHQNLWEKHLRVDFEEGLEKEDAIAHAKRWGVIPRYAVIAYGFPVKNEIVKDECAKIICENNEIGLQVASSLRDNLAAEKECLHKDRRIDANLTIKAR
jgi:hypothetical protein